MHPIKAPAKNFFMRFPQRFKLLRQPNVVLDRKFPEMGPARTFLGKKLTNFCVAPDYLCVLDKENAGRWGGLTLFWRWAGSLRRQTSARQWGAGPGRLPSAIERILV